MIGTFEWMELQSLSADITEARARLAEARTNGDQRLIRILEQEIATAEQRRSEIVVQLSGHLADNNEKAANHTRAEDATEDTEAELASSSVELTASPEDEFEGENVKSDESDIARDVVRDAVMTLAENAAPDEEPEAAADSPAQRPATESDSTSDPQDQDYAEVPLAKIADRATVVTAAQPEASGQGNNLKGEVMAWDQLTPEDLARAKEELVTRRGEMLARHAEELSALDADREQLAVLEQAIASFVRKFTAASDGSVVNLGDERERLIGNG